MTQKERSNPDFDPKHRIVGAIIVVSLAVIFLPMILDENEPPVEVKPISEIPASMKPDDQTETKVVVTPVSELQRDKRDRSASASSATGASKETEKPKAAAGDSGIATESPSKPAIEPQTKTVESPPPVHKEAQNLTKGWVVQVGTFTNTENATRLDTNLKKHGHATNLEPITLKGTKAVRLRVGPFRDKRQAQKAQAQIHKDVGVSGVVLAYP
jgi:DedD protein